MAKLKTEESSEGVTFPVKVVPGASHTALSGLHGESLKVRVAAPPEKGKANKCLCEHLAGVLGIRKQQVCVVSGHTSPVKRVEVRGVSRHMLLGRLQLGGRGEDS